MATAKSKKSTAKKQVKKTVVTPKAETAAPSPASVATATIDETPKRRGRPPGSRNKSGNRSTGKKSAGRPAATEFLYSLSSVIVPTDDLGLGSPVRTGSVIGPFPDEAAAIEAAMAEIGTQTDIQVTLYRDYRKGMIEVKTRLV